jgi:hypothetical protein
MSIVRLFLCTPYRDGSGYDDRLHLSSWLCDDGISWHAQRVARSPSPHFLLAGLHASGASGTKNLGRNGQVDASHHHCVALWAPAQSGLLEHASARQLVGAGSLGDLAATYQWDPADFSVVLFRPNFMLASEKYPMKVHKNQLLLTSCLALKSLGKP